MMVFLALLVAHLLGDFVLQRSAVVDGKHRGRWQSWIEHGAVHFVCLIGAWLLFSPQPLLDGRVGIAFTLILLTHLLVDWIKVRKGGAWPVTAFVLDQAFHLLVLAAVTLWLVGSAETLNMIAEVWLHYRFDASLILAAYLIVVFGCGWLNRLLLDSLYPGPSDQSEVEADAGLSQAGMRIGWLERFLMLSAFLAQAWAALGLVLAAKSVFRFEDIKRGRRHAEYFLIGTLVSVAEVVLVGMLVLGILNLEGAA